MWYPPMIRFLPMYVDVSVVVSAAPVRRTKARAKASVASSEMSTTKGVSFRGFVTSPLRISEKSPTFPWDSPVSMAPPHDVHGLEGYSETLYLIALRSASASTSRSYCRVHSRAMAEREHRGRVTGLGGIFFKAKDPKSMAQWYSRHLGMDIENSMVLFSWRGGRDGKVEGHTVWSIFPADTKYFGDDGASFMVNYRVKDLDAVLASLQREGVSIVPERQDSEHGRFAWVTDPEGNRIELWEPPKTYQAPETATTME